jgi:tetraacyldisaccharide-1-P 4'-kinase
MFRQPNFWKTINILSISLYPISILYSWISKARYLLQKPYHCKSKVICIGNVTIGGSGKTPLAIAIGKLLIAKKYKIAYACKNYGGSIKSATQVVPSHNPTQVIDEAMLLSKIAPTFIASTRLAAIKAASRIANIVIADDGLQNNSFHKDLSILAISEDKNFGNNLIFPAGPLRQSLVAGIKKSDLIFMMDETKKSHIKTQVIIENYLARHTLPSPSFLPSSRRRPGPRTTKTPSQLQLGSSAKRKKLSSFGESLVGLGPGLRRDDGSVRDENIFGTEYKYKLYGAKRKLYIAFCGIANPASFFNALEDLKIKLTDKITYPDHYVYSESDISALFERAKKLNVGLITTEKDLVKLDKTNIKTVSYLKLTTRILNKKNLFDSIIGILQAVRKLS